MDFSSIISQAVPVILLVLGFGFIIFVHELGHFLVAKWTKVKVTQFAIGFGHALVCWRKGIGFRIGSTERDYQQRLAQHLGAEIDPDSGHLRRNGRLVSVEEVDRANAELGLGETEYRLNWMPLGGYVKMVGQDDLDPTALSDDPRAFNKRPIWARVCVVSAGVIMNVIFAVVFFVIAFLHGVEFPPAIVGSVVPDSPAAKAHAVDHPEIVGLKQRDRIVLVNGEKPSDFTSIRLAAALAGPGESVDLVVDRPTDDGKTEQLAFQIMPEANSEIEGLKYIGIGSPSTLQLAGHAAKGSALADLFDKLGLEPGMTLTAIDGKPVTEHWQFDKAMDECNGRDVKFTFTGQDGRTKTITVHPQTDVETATLPIPGAKADDDKELVWHIAGLVPAAKIGQLAEKSAVEGKLESGDLIASIGDESWPTVAMVQDVVVKSGGKSLPVTVLRDGKAVSMTVTPESGFFSKPKLGIVLNYSMQTPIICRVLHDSPFVKLGLKPGTKIDSFNGQAVHNFTDLHRAIAAAQPGDATVTYTLPLPNAKPETGTIALTQKTIDAAKKLGWVVELPGFQMELEMQRADGVVDAVHIGFVKTKQFVLQTYVTLGRLFQGTVKVKSLRGPLGIVMEGTRIAEQGFAYLLFFLGLISVNLAVINFLPLPIVDGGLFVLLMIEKVRGRPVSPQIQSAITVAGLVVLGTIFLVVTFYDVSRMFG